MANTHSKTKDWRIWWQLFWRKKHIFFASLFLAIALGLFYSFITPPEYESVATIMYSDFDVLINSSMRVPGVPQREDIESFRRRITSTDFMLNLVDSLGIGSDPKLIAQIQKLHFEHPDVKKQELARQVYIEHLQKRITTRMKAYNLVEIRATGRTSDAAFRLATLLTHLAMAESRESQIRSVNIASSFSYQQLEIYKKKLAEAEDALNSFNNASVKDMIVDDKLDDEKLQELHAYKMSSEFDLQSKLEQIQQLRAQELKGAGLGYKQETEAALRDLKSRLLQRTGDLCQLLKRFNWRDIEVIQINEEIANLKNKANDRIRAAISLYYAGAFPAAQEAAVKMESLQLDVDLLRHAITTVSAILQGHNERLRQEPSREATKSRLEREVAVNQQIYDLLLEQVRGAQIRESAQLRESQLKFKLISPPQAPLERVKPHRRRIMMVAVYLGCMLGLGIILGLETIDASIKTVEDATNYLGVPVLGTIPRIVTRSEEHKQKRTRRILAIALPILAVFGVIVAFRVFMQ